MEMTKTTSEGRGKTGKRGKGEIDVGERDRLEAVHERKFIERRKRIQLAMGIQWWWCG